MFIKFICKSRTGATVTAVKLSDGAWLVFPEDGEEKFISNEDFGAKYVIEGSGISCEPECTHLVLKESAKEFMAPSKFSLFRCPRCGAWYTASRS